MKIPRNGNITFWSWLCGARVFNFTPDTIISLRKQQLITRLEARKYLNKMNGDYLNLDIATDFDPEL